ncbi:MAG: DUF4255 domain-containing protein [Acidimicrobiales bacterium]
MIHEIDETLRAIVKEDVIKGSDVEVMFDAPTKDWASRRNTPTIDLYLYDIREDLKRRQYGLVDTYNDEGQKSGTRQLPRLYKMSYLITAWTQRPEDEHRLLSAMLGCFLRNDAIPVERLQGNLADNGWPLAITIALPPPEDRGLSDVWSALGGELKPSLDLVVYAAFELDRFESAAKLVTETPRFAFQKGDDPAEEGPRRTAKNGKDADDEVLVAETPEEQFTGGTSDDPGRVFTIRGTTDRR